MVSFCKFCNGNKIWIFSNPLAVRLDFPGFSGWMQDYENSEGLRSLRRKCWPVWKDRGDTSRVKSGQLRKKWALA